MSELPEVVEALLDARAYPQPPGPIELLQTQMSFVFLTDEYAYKVKKPVDLGYLDYTTLEKRRFYCHKEVELNRRLCPEAYLGVVPVTRDKGEIAISGRGEVIEHAVQMRRLPAEKMMDARLARDQVTTDMVSAVALKLADFHRRAETGTRVSAFGSIETITRNTEENFSQTGGYLGRTISPGSYERIKNYTADFIRENTPLLQRRVAEGRIRDCHGDVHAAHVCFCHDICIYDCIEFNDRFRYCDVAAEVAFLAMDLDHYGRADLGHHFTRAYVEHGHDPELLRLLSFYKGYRAYVRGKVESFKLDDPYLDPAAKAQAEAGARSYFDLARAYTRPRPSLFITTGLVGTGKTTLARALARRLGLVSISSDITRKQLAGIPATEHRYSEPDTGIYAREFSRQTYETMLGEARGFLRDGVSVILDASFIRAANRLAAAVLAQETGADFFIVECTSDEDVIRERLAQRQGQATASDGRWEIYGPQKKALEPVTEVPPARHAIIDTLKPLEENMRQILGLLDTD